MSPESFAERVLKLERQMNDHRQLPEAVTELSTQFAQFRGSVRAEFSALRKEMADGFVALRSEIAAGDEETRRYMRVLHEDLVGRIALLQEGLNERKPRRGSGSSG